MGHSILVDARGIGMSGIGRYLREVLVRLATDERFSRLTLLGERSELRGYIEDRGLPAHRISIEEFDHPMYSPAAQGAWLRRKFAGGPPMGVSFFPHYDAPLLAMPPRSVVTVHDLIHFKVPSAFSRVKRGFGAVLLKGVVRHASRVLTGSDATRRDLIERFPRAAAKVNVVPYGVDSYFHVANDPRGIGADGSNGHHTGPFLLCVGNRKPHKNMAAAVEVLSLLRARRPELRLVVVGKRFAGPDDVLQRAEALGVADRVVEREMVSDVELRELYRGAEALLFPSLYEGFGLPALEAMSCGSPVIASNRSSVPEVVADGGVLVDPFDYEAMADAVMRLHQDAAARAALIHKGLERARRFSWEETASRTADHLYEVAAAIDRPSRAGMEVRP